MNIDKQAFFDHIRNNKTIFPRGLNQSAVDGINGILKAFGTHGDGSLRTLAYALATAYHETGARMVPVREGFATTDEGARRAVAALAKRRGPNSAVAKYAQPTGPYGHVYYGRGYVQLTWMEGYERSSKDAGVDLVKYPDMMLDPEISARVLIKGLVDGRWNGSKAPHRGQGIAYYIPAEGDVVDLKNARRTVNILDKWEDIAGYYRAFDAALFASKVDVVEQVIEPETVDQVAPTQPETVDEPDIVNQVAPEPVANDEPQVKQTINTSESKFWIKLIDLVVSLFKRK